MIQDDVIRITRSLGICELTNRPKQSIFYSLSIHDMLKVFNAVEEEVAFKKKETSKPVAVQKMMDWVDYLKRRSDYGQHMRIPSEISAGTCWELAIELEQFIKLFPEQKD